MTVANLDDRFYREDVGYADMVEAPRREKESGARGILLGSLMTLVVLVLAVVLIRGSLPEMTPEQIVQRKDYEGQQPPRHIFNLYSLKQQKERNELSQANSETLGSSGSVTSVETVSVKTPSGKTVLPSDPVIIKEIDPVVVKEMAAARIATTTTVTTAMPEQDVESLSADNSAEISLSSLETGNSQNTEQAAQENFSRPVTAGGGGTGSQVLTRASEVTVLPVYTVEKDNTNLRSSPGYDSSVIKLLAIGQTMTVFDRDGEWVQVATNDGRGTTGYVHRSLLEIKDR